MRRWVWSTVWLPVRHPGDVASGHWTVGTWTWEACICGRCLKLEDEGVRGRGGLGRGLGTQMLGAWAGEEAAGLQESVKLLFPDSTRRACVCHSGSVRDEA